MGFEFQKILSEKTNHHMVFLGENLFFSSLPNGPNELLFIHRWDHHREAVLVGGKLRGPGPRVDLRERATGLQLVPRRKESLFEEHAA